MDNKYFRLPLHSLYRNKADSVAQLVEHITFNDGVLGSSPSGITKTERSKNFKSHLISGFSCFNAVCRRFHTYLTYPLLFAVIRTYSAIVLQNPKSVELCVELN